MDYLMEAGVTYRPLKDNEHPVRGEYLRRCRAFYHPTGSSFEKRYALTMDNRGLWLQLLNHWNRQPEKGWSYHSIDG